MTERLSAAQFDAACAAACPHCGASNAPRFRPETQEFVHTFSANERDLDTPTLEAHGGPKRLVRGAFAQTLCQATKIRLERSKPC